MKKTIAKIARDYMVKNNIKYISYGDLGWFDDIADLCTHTTLMKAHPLDRHIRLLNALDKSSLFVKHLVQRCNAERPNQYCREFVLKK